MKPTRFTRGSRKHRIGKGRAQYVMATSMAAITVDSETKAVMFSWIGDDDRGRELEIVAVERPDCILVIHVMPTHYRKDR